MTEEKLPFCECGCGLRITKPGNRFIQGHTGGRTSKPKPEALPCECGCGELAKPGDRFIYMHHRKGKKNSSEHRAKTRKALKGVPRDPFSDEWRLALSISHTGYIQSEAEKFKKSKWQKENPQTGLDLVWHHVAYDFGRPDALRVRITKKFHSSIHHPKGIPLTERGYSLID